MIQNPILPGFNPDPSILRVGEDYYIATSTFEWYPGVSIYHSRDLHHWTLIARPLNRLSQLDMRGNPDSCGVWAPCLSYHQGRFYLCFTDVKRFAGDFKDTHNYIVHSENIEGPWSEPVYINSSGFDPSLFVDEDGQAYFLNMRWDHRPKTGRNNWSPSGYFGGIVLQELNLDTLTLAGKPALISPGTDIGLSEGPHLYKRDGYYYLLLAEGGTGKDHACSFQRAKDIRGPYESDPKGPIVTSANSPDCLLKRAGHGDWVETPQGDCFLVHLCSRPLPHRGRSVLGRETAMQRIQWQDGWPRLESGGQAPCDTFASPYALDSEPRATEQHLTFDASPLPLDFQSLRIPLDDTIMNQTDRPGYLRLYGRESLGSLFTQALIARRQQAMQFEAETAVEFAPDSFQQMAGLVCYYNSKKYYYLHLTCDDEGRRVLDVSMCCNDAHSQYPLASPISLPEQGHIKLKATVDQDLLHFSYALEDGEWQSLGLRLDYSVLSDEVGDGGADANFTGAFVGMCCQDLTGMNKPADFAFFAYREPVTDK